MFLLLLMLCWANRPLVWGFVLVWLGTVPCSDCRSCVLELPSASALPVLTPSLWAVDSGPPQTELVGSGLQGEQGIGGGHSVERDLWSVTFTSDFSCIALPLHPRNVRRSWSTRNSVPSALGQGSGKSPLKWHFLWRTLLGCFTRIILFFSLPWSRGHLLGVFTVKTHWGFWRESL